MAWTRLQLAALPIILGCAGGLFSISVGESASTTVEGGGLVGGLTGSLGFTGLSSMGITASEELQNQGVAPGDIDGASLVYFEMEALDGQGDLAFIDSLSVYVAAPDQPEQLLASSQDFPTGQAVVALSVEPLDLTPYIVSESMTLTTDVSGELPDEDTTVEARFELDVRVTGQGACNQL